MRNPHTSVMRMKLLAAGLLLTAVAPLKAETSSVLEPAMRPAYRAVERVSDGVYSVLRSHLIGNLLPDRLTRHMSGAPSGDSYGLFAAELKKKQARLIRRLSADYPIQNSNGLRNPAEMTRWQARLEEEQVGALVDSLGDALVDRYQMEAFGRSSSRYATDRRNWDPGFLTMAGILGGTFLYVNGLHTETRLGAFKLGLDVRSGVKLQKAIQSGTGSRLASLEVAFADSPLSLQADCGLDNGSPTAERLNVRYSIKF